MTQATLQALTRIECILHEAGWDQLPTAPEPIPPPVDLTRVRHAYETLLNHDHFDILQALLGEPLTVEQFADKLARTDDRRRLGETLRRLREFVDSCGG